MAGTIGGLLVGGGTLYGVWNDTGNAGNLFQIPLSQGASTSPASVFQTMNVAFSRSLQTDGSYIWYATALNASPLAGVYAIRISNLTGTPVKESSTFNNGAVYNLAINGGHMYWDQGTGTAYEQLGVFPSTNPIAVTSTVREIGSDGTNVYWDNGTNIYSGTGDVNQNRATLGTTPTNVIFTHVAFDSANAYFSDDSGVYRIAKGGGALVGVTSAFANESPNVIAPDPDDTRNALYYCSLDPTTYQDQTVWKVAKDGSNKNAVAFASTGTGVHPTAVTADATAVYWATDNGQVWKQVK
jgi:hypothetical protein